MTTPDPLDGISLPSSYVAEINQNGTGTMRITAGSESTVYIFLPIGVSTIQVTWSGTAELRVNYRSDGTGESSETVMTIPSATGPTVRTAVMQIAADHPDARISLATSFEGAGDASRRAGVILIPTTTNFP